MWEAERERKAKDKRKKHQRATQKEKRPSREGRKEDMRKGLTQETEGAL